MKKQKRESLVLRKKAISKLDRFIIGGRAVESNICTQNPQTPSLALTACKKDCPVDTQTPEPTNMGC